MSKIQYISYLICGFLILAVSLYGFVLLRGRLDLPPEINFPDLINKKSGMLALDGMDIKNEKDVEFIMSQKRMKKQSSVLLRVKGENKEKQVSLILYYRHAPFPLIYLVIGLFCFVIGFSVFFLRPEERKAGILYWGILAFSSSIIISGGYHCLREDLLSYLPGILFYFLYPLAPAFLLHFSLSFSGKIKRSSLLIIYTPALLFSLALESAFILSSSKSSIGIYRLYQFVYYFFRFFIVIFVIAAILHFFISYIKTVLEVPRAQLKWILYGLFVGLGPFILLYQLPLALRLNPLISDELSNIFFIFIPLAFAVSIIRFKLMNIELIINRSLVYGMLTIFTVALYLFSVYILQNLFRRFFNVQEMAVSVFAALAAAAAFHPARKKIQEFVDKSFYRLSYDYRKTILGFNEKAQRMISRDHLLKFFLMKLQKVLPLEHIGIHLHSKSSDSPSLFVKEGQEIDIENIESICLESSQILAQKGTLKIEENVDFCQEKLLKEKGLQMILPLSFRHEDLSGLLTLGEKMSGERYSRDDLELLETMAGVLVLNLERIRLQEEVIYERAEKKKLDELNTLKTEFISTVSHELRTPMSSIHGLTELLQEGRIKNEEKRAEILKLVASESSRLSKLLHNILDFGKIEQQTKTYKFQKVDICHVLQDVMIFFQPRFEKENFTSRVFLPQKPLHLIIDQDAVKEALINLIDNAIKYSSDKREIMIQLIEKEKQVEIQVKDRGIGIPSKEQEKIFEGFYRHSEASQHNPKGVGLGLKIVKHIMEAHKGEIRVESQPNKGSTFSLIFPKP